MLKNTAATRAACWIGDDTMPTVPRNKGSYTERRRKLRNGEDSVTYQVKYPMGWSEEKGKYDEYREDVASEAEAVALIKTINDYVYHGGDPTEVPAWRAGKKAEGKACTLTVEQFSDEFIEMREKQHKVEPRTIESDRQCFARIKPYIGSKLLTAISPRDIDMAYAHMRSDGPDNLAGRVYSGTTLQKTHMYLSMLFDKAIDYECIAENPMAKVERPKRDTAEKRSLSPEQAQALFSSITSEPPTAKGVGTLLCLCCGLRESEMLALTWSDYANGEISVSKSLVREKQEFKGTKNGEERTIPCMPALVAVLEEWRELQKTYFASIGLGWSEDAPIVSSRVGNHTLQRSFGKWFERMREEWPIPSDFTVHGLRHTFVSLLNRDCGTDARTTRSLSGHKSEQAFAIYTHTNREWQRKAVSELGEIIAPEEGAETCRGCKYWAASPLDATKGACWAQDGTSVPITIATKKCSTGLFSIKAAS